MTEDKKPDTLMVFSGKSLETMIKAGGCGDWVLDKDRASRRRYLVVVRNRHAPWSEEGVDHGIAWLVGKISDVVKASGDRWLVKLDEYALINVKKPWGSRNPVGYTRLDELGIDSNELEWKVFPSTSEVFEADAPPVVPANGVTLPLTFEQAKQGLAMAMGIRPEQIEITIRA